MLPAFVALHTLHNSMTGVIPLNITSVIYFPDLLMPVVIVPGVPNHL